MPPTFTLKGKITDAATAKSVLYAPGLGAIDDAVWAGMKAAACVLVDGTCWTDDELVTAAGACLCAPSPPARGSAPTR